MLLLLWLGGYRAVVVIQAAVTASKEGIQKLLWTDPAALPDHRVSCGVWYSRVQKHKHNQTQSTSSQTGVIQPRCCCYLQFLGKACCISTGCRLSWGSHHVLCRWMSCCGILAMGYRTGCSGVLACIHCISSGALGETTASLRSTAKLPRLIACARIPP